MTQVYSQSSLVNNFLMEPKLCSYIFSSGTKFAYNDLLKPSRLLTSTGGVRIINLVFFKARFSRAVEVGANYMLYLWQQFFLSIPSPPYGHFFLSVAKKSEAALIVGPNI